VSAPKPPPDAGGAPRREFLGWEEWYQRRDHRRMPWYSPRPSPWLVRAVTERRFRPGSSLLDVGCGTGTNALWLAQHGFRVHGVDVSPTAIAIGQARARRRRVRVDLRVGSADRLPFGRRSLDGAVDTGCFHSIPTGLRSAYARELGRVLRPEAAFLLTWIPREVRTELGPPHRPSLAETAAVFEAGFVFVDVHWYGMGSPEGWPVLGERMGRCTALLVRRRGRPPTPQ
jgi:SAM-dependent methyltransferase